MRLIQVDAFTAAAFRGNPAAVCLLDRERDDAWMQNVAAEMNLSETAFLLQRDDGYSLRWFTPAVEVALCGHATLASAHALWEEQLLDANERARFYTKSGLLTADRDGEWIELDFPATAANASDAPDGLLDALGLAGASFIGRNKFDYLVEVDSEETVRALAPDHARLRTIPVRGVIVTSRASNGDYDFVSRFFAPGSGVDEDPVTGSAHCALAPYWAAKLGREELTGFQASARGGIVRVRVDGARVKLRGNAVTVLRGELVV
ncbi:MAG: PhzF family phenazine biosynthesis protein [Acidobacteria bacterium]|nr:PhzF family phenazine biosynthesis protein [Acidobacteriota bacterium]MBV9475855.1 PhzF family phenazine biosynthesis protein [Acidobacteriota bacterium]